MRLPERPALRLPRTARSFHRPVAVSALVHLAVLVLLVSATGRSPRTAPARPPGPPQTGGAERVDYLALPPYRAPAPPDQTRPRRPPPEPVVQVEVQDVTPTRSLADAIPLSALAGNLQVGRMGGLGGSAGSGASAGSVGGTGAGPGGGNEVFPPQARYSILPPLPAPASVRGKSFRVHFWVNPAGQVTRVQVRPPIPDAEYRELFMQHMYQYRFAPAIRPDGTPVAGETVLVITL